MRAIIHIPTKSLTFMPLFFGKDKGFFIRKGVDVDLVLMSLPTAIASLLLENWASPRRLKPGSPRPCGGCRSSASCTFNST